jgi:hypothetical protein
MTSAAQRVAIMIRISLSLNDAFARYPPSAELAAFFRAASDIATGLARRRRSARRPLREALDRASMPCASAPCPR